MSKNSHPDQCTCGVLMVGNFRHLPGCTSTKITPTDENINRLRSQAAAMRDRSRAGFNTAAMRRLHGLPGPDKARTQAMLDEAEANRLDRIADNLSGELQLLEAE